jgi:hypothetical protein
MFLSKNTGYMLNDRTYSNIIIGIFIVKLIFSLFFFVDMIIKIIYKNPTLFQTYYLDKINELKDFFDIIFRTSACILLIYLFTPHYHSYRMKHINYETSVILFVYGIFLLLDNIGLILDFYKNKKHRQNETKPNKNNQSKYT